MARVSRELAGQHRRAIAEASARLFRERGFREVSVADLTAAAGLTHGGFYGHFASKDALAAEACALAFEHSCDRWRRRVADAPTPASARNALIEAYVSTRSRNNPGASCPAAALAADVAREGAHAPVRAAFTAGIEDLVRILASVEPDADPAAARTQALADLSTMAGALILARATAGQPLADEFLAAARARLGAAQGA
jgi:TetR/AcrR family transcriptional repressor of nem operon